MSSPASPTQVYLLESAMASVSGSGQQWTLACKSWDCALPAAASLTLKFIVVHAPNDQALPTEVAFPDADTALCHDTSYDCSTAVTETGEVEGASWTGVVEVAGEVAGWTLDITFSAAVTAVESAVADVARVADTNWLLTNKSWDGDVGAGEHLSVPFIVTSLLLPPHIYSIFSPHLLLLHPRYLGGLHG